RRRGAFAAVDARQVAHLVHRVLVPPLSEALQPPADALSHIVLSRRRRGRKGGGIKVKHARDDVHEVVEPRVADAVLARGEQRKGGPGSKSQSGGPRAPGTRSRGGAVPRSLRAASRPPPGRGRCGGSAPP